MNSKILEERTVAMCNRMVDSAVVKASSSKRGIPVGEMGSIMGFFGSGMRRTNNGGV